jgi:PPM family protein phosphatase
VLKTIEGVEMIYYGITDRGMRREHNEDCYLLPSGKKADDIKIKNDKQKKQLFLLCDGMGGANAGEVASQMTARWFKEEYLKAFCLSQFSLFFAILNTNKKIYKLSIKHEQYRGMGTTLIAALFRNNKYVSFFSVGDSRAYLLRDRELKQLTEDQSEVWKLYKSGAINKDKIGNHPGKHIVTNAIGIKKTMTMSEINHVRMGTRKNDLYLLCSDGLTDMLTDSTIQRILNQCSSLQSKAEELVAAANEAGGMDNITVILIMI